MNKTKINWCDYSYNPITGCTKIAQGCKNCYAEGIAKRFWGERKFSDVQFHPERLNDKKLSSKKPLRIFVNSMSDLFHEDITDLQIFDVFLTMAQYSQHTFLVLTKRIRRAMQFTNMIHFIKEGELQHIHHNSCSFGSLGSPKPLPNVWLIYSASTQQDLSFGINWLMNSTAVVKGLSLEPLIEPIDLYNKVDWVIIGHESGKNRRMGSTEDVRGLVNYCKQAKIPVWVKQLQLGLYSKITDNLEDFPEDLRIRELPK